MGGWVGGWVGGWGRGGRRGGGVEVWDGVRWEEGGIGVGLT